MSKGTVKFFNESKGYGFITNDETGKDIFVHVTALGGVQLNDGDKVQYEEEEGKKGKVAGKVIPIDDLEETPVPDKIPSLILEFEIDSKMSDEEIKEMIVRTVNFTDNSFRYLGGSGLEIRDIDISEEVILEPANV